MKSKVLGIITLILMITALYMIFIYAPTEVTQGIVQRIFYVHLPLAFGGYTSALLLFIGCVMFLLKREFKWDRFAMVSAELGVVFTSAQLMTGMIWAKPVWGIWWTFDARLTLQLILDLIFIAYFMLRAYLPDREKKAKLSAVFGLLGMVDVPFNYLAIYMFPTQHPQPVVSPGGGGLDPDMWKALITSFIAFGFLYAYLFDRRSAVAKVEEEVDYLNQVVFTHE